MKALIAGGGIAGTVAAMALKKAGVEATVFEAHAHASDGVGSFLTLAVNGLEALRTLDFDLRLLTGAFATPRFVMHFWNGRKAGELANGPQLADGTVSLTVKRADLYAGLRDEALRRGVTFEYGKRILDASATASGAVVARFEDGTSAEGDLLIGADGLHSKVRSLIDPNAPKARFVGLLNFGGFAKGVEVPELPGDFHMLFGKRSFFAWLRNPNGEVWWFANPWRDREPDRAELAATRAEAWRTELLTLFEDDVSPAAKLIDATPDLAGGWASYDFPKVPRWHRDRMIIIGDAAHAASPSSGQGASMAIEDAVVLARCLGSGVALEQAFEAYETERRTRVQKIVAHGKRNGSGKAPGAFGRVVRDFFMGFVFRYLEKNGADAQRWIYDYRVG